MCDNQQIDVTPQGSETNSDMPGQHGSGNVLYCPGTGTGESETPAIVEIDDAVIEAQARATPEERANGLIRGLMFILNHHDAPKEVCDSFRTQATAYLVVPDEAVFFKRAKYLTVAPMAWYLRCEAPKKPDLAFEPAPGSHWKRWSHSRRAFCRRNTHLWYSWLQGKRAALPLSDELVLTTYEEHRVAMGLSDPISVDTLDRVMKELEPVLSKIERTLQSTYAGARLMDCDEDPRSLTRETRRVASTRACFESSRSKGGQLGYLSGLVGTLGRLNPKNSRGEWDVPDLVRMVFLPMAVVDGHVRTNVVVEEYAYPDGERQWTESIQKEAVNWTGTRKVPVYNTWRYQYSVEEPVRLQATIQAVLEPLKVRVISKGNAVPYYMSKQLQVALHSIMREMPCFRLIGRPLCPTDLFDLAANRSILGKGQYEWFSIDYSAATDKLSAKLSSAIMTRLLRGYDPQIREMWMAVLAPHKVKYPFPYSEKVAPIMQKNGQLMGSILSFPILCLANLGLYLTNISQDTRPLKDKLAGVLVNGDDMLYVAKHSMWAQHVELGNKVGLVMSPGKAYAHPVYANANSACYHYDLRNSRSTPFSIPFLNSGLYFGQNKVLGGDDIESANPNSAPKCSVINRLLDGARPGKACDVLAGYLSRHRKAIESETKGRNLFIPQSLGGMGVNPPVGWKFTITAEQQWLGARRLCEEPYGHLGGRPLPAGEVPEAPVALKAPWLAELSDTTDAEPYRSRSWKGKYEGSEMLSKRNLLVPFESCKKRRIGASTVFQKRPLEGNVFVRRKQRDLMRDQVDSIAEELSTYVEPSAWTLVGNSLDVMLTFEMGDDLLMV